jgi:glucosamine-phosphate N-acetyltransferase
MNIREFEVGDVEKGLLETLSEVWYITEITEEIIKEHLDNDNILFVVEEDGVIIGTLTLHLQKKLIRNGGIAGMIEDVAVRKKYRGNNIGSLLVQKAIDKSIEIGCYKVILSCFPDRINFYKRNGFINESITMRHNLK